MALEKKDIVIWLSHIEGIGNRDIKCLINYFHNNIEEVWYAGRKHIVNALGGKEELANKIMENRDEQFFIKISKALKDNNIFPLTIYDSAYPSKLKNIYDPPYTIFIKGNKIEFDMPLISIVGTRRATPYGKWAAHRFAKELAEWGRRSHKWAGPRGGYMRSQGGIGR